MNKLNIMNIFIQNLTLEQTEELHNDIERYLSLEQSETNIDFWTVGILYCFAVAIFNEPV